MKSCNMMLLVRNMACNKDTLHINVYVLAVIIFTTGVHCKDIHVSQQTGENISKCGNIQHHCKSLTFAILKVSSDNDTIILDGGDDKSLIYFLINTISISHSLFIKKNESSRYKPVIAKESKQHFNIYAFRFLNASKANLYLLSIQFVNIGIVYFGGSGIKSVIINDCIVRYKKSPINYSIILNCYKKTHKRSIEKLILMNSQIETTGNVIYFCNTAMVTTYTVIQNTSILYGRIGIYSRVHSFSLMSVKNVTFKQPLIYGIYAVGLHTAQVINCQFNGSKTKTLSYAVLFSAASKNTKVNVRISKCSFSNYQTEFALLQCHHCNLTANRLLFNRNTKTKNGIFIWNSIISMTHVNIDNSIFTEAALNILSSTQSILRQITIELCSYMYGFLSAYSHITMDSLTFSKTKMRQNNNTKIYDFYMHQSDIRLGHLKLDKSAYSNIGILVRSSILTSNNIIVTWGSFHNLFEIYNSTVKIDMVKFLSTKMNAGLIIRWNTNATITTTSIMNCTGNHSLVISYATFVMDSVIITKSYYTAYQPVRFLSANGIFKSIYLFRNRMSTALAVFHSQAFFGNITLHENTFYSSAIYLAITRHATFFQSIAMLKNKMRTGVHGYKTSANISYAVFDNNIVNFHLLRFQRSNCTIQNSVIRNYGSNSSSSAMFFDHAGEKNLYLKIQNSFILWERILDGGPDNSIISFALENNSFTFTNITIQLLMSKPHTTVYTLLFDPAIKKNSLSIDMNVRCPPNYNTRDFSIPYDKSYTFQLECQSCSKNTYSTNSGEMHINGTTYVVHTNAVGSPSFFQSFNSNTKRIHCNKCPVGGECNNGIRSTGNYFGYKTKNGLIKFISCPTGYCCSHGKCSTFNSCNKLRTGILCGTCHHGYYESYFSAECIPKTSCKQVGPFWLLYVLSVAIFTITLCYLNDFGRFFKWAVSKLLSVLSQSQAFMLPVWNSIKIRRKRTNTKERNINFDLYCTNESTNNISQSRELTNEIGSDNELANDSFCNKKLNNLSIATGNETSIIEENKPNSNISSANEVVDIRNFTVSGVFAILISFYQVKSLITVDLNRAYGKSDHFTTFVTKIFNLDFMVKSFSTLCPTVQLNPLLKRFFREVLFSVIAVCFICISFLTAIALKKLKKHGNEHHSKCLQFHQRLGLGYLRILLVGYKNMATFSIMLLHCVKVDDKFVLYIYGNLQCFTWWQRLDLVFIISWVLIFPLALHLSFTMCRDKRVSFWEFLLCISIPACLILFFKRRIGCCKKVHQEIDYEDQLIADFRSVFEESFRLRKGHTNKYIFWESIRLYQRLALAFLCMFIVNPIIRICVTTSVIIIYSITYLLVLPYKRHLRMLHWMEIASLMSFCYFSIFNMMLAIIYVFNIPNRGPIPLVLKVFYTMDAFFTPFSVTILYFIVKLITSKTVLLVNKIRTS